MTKNRAHPFSLPPKLLLFFDLFLALSPTQIDAHHTYFRSRLSLLSCPTPICIRSHRDCSQEGSQALAFLLSLLLSPWLKSLLYSCFVCAPAAVPKWLTSFQFLSSSPSLFAVEKPYVCPF